MAKLDALKPVFDLFRFTDITIQTASFDEYAAMPKIHGLYSIWQGDTCVYVGQAGGKSGMKDRFKHHYNKAHAIFESKTGKKNSTSDTTGWALGREQAWWNPLEWTVEYFECAGEVNKSLLETAMMKLFDPFCNEECLRDRQAGNKFL